MTLNANIIVGLAFATIAFFGAGAAVNAQASAPQTGPVLPASPTIPDRAGVWGDIVYGAADAPVELIEYASLTCSHCANFARNVLPRLMVDFINDGKVRLVFRNFVLNRLDLAAAAASRCMADEGATKRTISTLFSEQSNWLQSENQLAALAEIVGREGLDQQGFQECLQDQQVRVHIVEMTQLGAKNHNVNSTPTLVLNGVAMSFPGYDSLKLRIEAQLGSDYLNKE